MSLAPPEGSPSSFRVEQEKRKHFSEPHLKYAGVKLEKELQNLELGSCNLLYGP